MKKYLTIGVIIASFWAGALALALPHMETYRFPPAATMPFSSPAPGQWQIQNGALTNGTDNAGFISFDIGEDNWADFEVEFRFRLLKTLDDDHHFGITGRNQPDGGVRFYCRGDSIMYIADTRHDMLGNLPEALSMGADAPWSSLRVAFQGDEAWVFLNHTLIGTLRRLQPRAGKITFNNYNFAMEISEIKVTVTALADPEADKTGVRSPNLLSNSSFEFSTLDRLPDYWGVSQWGVGDPYWATRYEQWLEYFTCDDSTAFDGKRSMRLHNPTGGKQSAFTLRSVLLGTAMNTDYTLSAYLKSEPAGMKVDFHGKIMTVDAQWQRYSTEFRNADGSFYQDMINIAPLEKGTLWVDALQLEVGPMTAYQPMTHDPAAPAAAPGTPSEARSIPRYDAARLTGAIHLDGKPDEAGWNNAAPLQLRGLTGETPKNPTEAKILYDDNGIYLGVTCFNTVASTVPCTVTGRDENVWLDDSLELFIDPRGGGTSYYHLALNRANAAFDALVNDSSWNGVWQSAVYEAPDGKYWSAELFLPFHQWQIDRTTAHGWRFNLGRNSAQVGESTAWAPTYGGFHNPDKFGELNLDAVDWSTYQISVSGVQAARLDENRASLEIELLNLTGSTRSCQVTASVYDGTKPVAQWEQEAILSQGIPTKLAMGSFPGTDGKKYRVQITVRTVPELRQIVNTERTLTIPEVMKLKTRYSLYTGEITLEGVLQVNLPAEVLPESYCNVQLIDASGRSIINRRLTATEFPCFILALDGVEAGSYTLSAELKNQVGKVLATDHRELQKLAPAASETKIDHFARMIAVDGQPFFPLGITLEHNRTPEALEYYAAHGMNTFVFYPEPGHPAETLALLDAAAKTGTKVVLSLGADKFEAAESMMRQFKEHPAILAWNAFDEIFTFEWGMANHETVADYCARLQKLDPYHPVFINENAYGMNFLVNRNLEFPGSIVSLDYYAYPPSGNLQMTTDYVKTMERLALDGERPVWIYLLGAGYAFWASRDYTPAEHEFSAYTSIIHGVRGISYFSDHPKSPSSWQKILSLANEIHTLTPLLILPAAQDGIVTSNDAIDFTVRRSGNELYLIAVNHSEQPQQVNFVTGGTFNYDIEVLFENRKLSWGHGEFTDSFAPLQRHVYQLKNKGGN